MVDNINTEYGPIMLIIIGIMIGSFLHYYTALLMIFFYIIIKNQELPIMLGGLTPQYIIMNIFSTMATQLQNWLYIKNNNNMLTNNNLLLSNNNVTPSIPKYPVVKIPKNTIK